MEKYIKMINPKHIYIFLGFLAAMCIYIERVSFSIAYTALVKSSPNPINESEKGKILAVFFIGYAISQIPGATLAQKYGASKILFRFFLIWSTVSIFMPTDVKYNNLIAISRMAIGLSQGVVIPSIHTILSQNIPPNERAMATSLTTSGMYLGSTIAILAIPIITKLKGPAFVFQLMGALGFIWMTFQLILIPTINPESKKYELPSNNNDINSNNNDINSSKSENDKNKRIPWRPILKSMAVWSIVVNNFSFHYSVYVVMNWLPTYFNDLIKSELYSIGNIKALPYLAIFIASNFGGWLGNYFILRHNTTVAMGRKLVNSIGFGLTMFFILCMPYAQNVLQGVICTTLVMASLGISRGGFSVNHMDIAPKYAGIVMGISNSAGTLSGVIGVAVTGYILDIFGGSGELAGWFYSLLICAIISLFGSILFIKYGEGTTLF